MAEICYEGGGGVLSENEAKTLSSSSQCEPTSRAARRRRMDIRRDKYVAGVPLSVPVPELDHDPKRHKNSDDYTSSTNSSSFSRDFLNAIDHNCGSDRQQEQQVDLNEFPIPSPEAVHEEMNEMPKFGKASVCGRRRDMEDAIAVHPSFCRQDDENASQLHFLGVYDGHGCSHVAMKCRDRMHELVKDEYCLLSKNRESNSATDWKNLMEKSFDRMDKEVSNAACKDKRTVSSSPSSSSLSSGAYCRRELQIQTPVCNAVGSTAVVAVLTHDKIIVSNCGDSRAVLCRKGKAIPLSSDHKPDRPDELRRIEAAGGRVIYWEGARVLGVLAMSRAIGDNYLKPYVICEPEITITDRSPEDECLILASDGLWDVVSNETACGVVRMCLHGNALSMLQSLPETELSGAVSSDKICSDAAMLLTKLALARHSGDNVSVVVVDLKKAT